ncbi:hypothetical protein ACJX0J_035791, partial [Zea mays]
LPNCCFSMCSGLISYKKLLFHGLYLWTALSLPQPLGRAALWPPHRTIHQHLQFSSSSKRWSFLWSGSKMLGKHHLQQLAATPPPPHHGSYKNTLRKVDSSALTPKEKYETWKEIKIMSFRKTVSPMWAMALLSLYLSLPDIISHMSQYSQGNKNYHVFFSI